jgi:hypothetical protein
MKHFLTVKLLQNQSLSLLLIVLAMSLIIFPGKVLAKDYKVEILVFKNIGNHRAFESYRNSEIDEMLSNAGVWQLEPTMLEQDATSIVDSEDYLLTHHLSWGQESLPYSESAAVNIIEQKINGWIKVYASHLLFINLDLDFNGYRMNEKRRIKLNEKHFFDHPKFGLLVQVSRLEEAEADEPVAGVIAPANPQLPSQTSPSDLEKVEGYLKVEINQTMGTSPRE